MGTALGQGALVLAAPILARLFDPQDFGILSVYAAVLSVLVAVASLRFDLAIPIARDPVESIDLLVVSVVLAVASSLVVGAVLLLWGVQLFTALGVPSMGPFLWLLPVALLVAGVTQALASWAVYHRKFAEIGRLRAVQGLGQAAIQALLGFFHAGPLGLVVGDLAGRALGTGQLLRSLFTDLRSTDLDVGRIRTSSKERWGFARVMTAASLLSALSLQVPFLLIPALFDLESSGQYFLAYRVLVLPASLVSAAVSSVFFGEASFRRADSGKLHDLARTVAVSLFIFSIPTYGIVALFGGDLFRVVFGPEWDAAGLYAQILAPSLVLWSVASPMSSLPLVGRRERESLAFTAAELGLRATALGMGAVVHSLTVGLALLTLTSILLNTAALWRFLRVASVTLAELARPVGRVVAVTVPVICLLVIVGRLAPAVVVVTSFIGWGVAVLIAARISPELRALTSGSHD